MQYYGFDCGCKFPTTSTGGIKLDIKNVPLTCQRTWDIISQGLTKGVFQLESPLGKQWTKKLKPQNMEHLSALGALLRPGCVASGTRIATSIQDRANRNITVRWLAVENLYHKFHNNHNLYQNRLVSIDEQSLLAYHNIIKDVIHTGKKEVHKVKINLHKRKIDCDIRYGLECTLDHPLFTHNKGWVQLQNIMPGERVAVLRRTGIKSKTKKNIDGEKTFSNICWRHCEYCCVFCNWHEASLDVNHLDGNRKTNNEVQNLSFMCPNHHRMYTEGKITKDMVINAREQWKIRNSKDIIWAEYTGTELIGEKDTYDITVDGPNYNFIANNIVVHNCLRALDEEGVSMTEHYCRRKNGEEPVQYFHPALKPILETTYGVLTYQEQAMAIARAIAGFDLQKADELRKAIGKKLPEEMEKVRIKFIDGIEVAKIVTKDEGDKIFGWIKESQRYSFNKCVHADTVIKRMFKGKHTCSLTVEEMYNIRNDINYAKATGHLSLYKKWKLLGHYGTGLSMHDDKRIKPNIIKDITYAGEKVTYRVITESGAYIDVTSNHKFPTPDGIKTTLDLKYVYVCGQYEITDFAKINKFSDWTIEDIHNKLPVIHDTSKGFMNGKNNPSFTNGAYTEFILNSQQLPLYCQLCGAVGCRLEVHHKDRNRSHNKIENLIRLCVSCHKKEDYKIGRTTVGEKGYPVKIEKVVLITAQKVASTYDVTMTAPHHNFVANNGIVTCNSHSMCYAINGYYCAYCKAHFPIQTYTSWLFHAHDKQDPKQEVRELINEAKMLGIDVLPPDILNLQPNFYTDGKVITFGLADIKGIGHSIVKKIKEIIQVNEAKYNKKFKDWTWFELLSRVGPCKGEPGRIGESVLSAMISAGALRHFGSNRTKLLDETRKWAKLSKGEMQFIAERSHQFTDILQALKAVAPLKSAGGGCHSQERKQTVEGLINLLEHPASKMEDSANWIAGTEEILLGTAITCSRIDACDQSAINATCRDFVNNETSHRGSIILGVEIQEVKEVKTRKGKDPGRKMARVVILDGTCAVDAVCFPDAYKSFGHLLTKGNTVIVQGERDRGQGSFNIHKVWQANLLEE
jgi:intein/homing endonuclease